MLTCSPLKSPSTNLGIKVSLQETPPRMETRRQPAAVRSHHQPYAVVNHQLSGDGPDKCHGSRAQARERANAGPLTRS